MSGETDSAAQAEAEPAAPAEPASRSPPPQAGKLPPVDPRGGKPKGPNAYSTALLTAVDPVGDPLRPPRTPMWRGNPKNLLGTSYSTFVKRAHSQPSFFHADLLPALPRTPADGSIRKPARSRDGTRPQRSRDETRPQRSRDEARASRQGASRGSSRGYLQTAATSTLLTESPERGGGGETDGASSISSSDGSQDEAEAAFARHAGGIAARLNGRATADPEYGRQGRALTFARNYEAVRRVVTREGGGRILAAAVPLAERLEAAYGTPLGTPMSLDGTRSCSSLPTMARAAAAATPEPSAAASRLGESLGARGAPAAGWSVGRRVQGAERLELAFYGLGDRRTAALIDPSKGGGETVTALDARENRLTAAAVPAIVAALKRNPHIKVLDLTSNAIGRDGCLALARALRGPPPLPLARLSLYNNKIGTYGITFLVECVKRNSTLTALDISRNDCSERASLALAETLEENQTLKVLGMSWNLVRGRAAAALAQALHINVGLTELDLSWNGLGDRDGQMLGIALGRNSSLKVLDVSHNRLRELACVNIAQGLKRNNTLERLVLDSNPLGRAGARFIVLAIDAAVLKGFERAVSLVGCDIEAQNSSIFNAQEPSGHYALDLASLYDRVVAEELIKLARELPGENLRNVTHQGRPIAIPDDERAWQLPTFGTLKFDFVFCRLRPTEPVDDGTVVALMRAVADEAQVMAKIARVASDALYFSCAQVHRFLDACGAGESMRRVEVIAAMFARVLDRESVPELLDRLAPWEREALVRLIGQLYYFVPENPTGHYVLDLKNPHERAVACWLQEIGNLEMQENEALGYPDTSQKGNRENWRNEVYLRVPFAYEGWWSVPSEGTLELDYVSTRRPPADAAPASPAEIEELREQVLAARVEDIDAAFAQRPVVVPGGDAPAGAAPGRPDARAIREWQPMFAAIPPKKELPRSLLADAASRAGGGKKSQRGKTRGGVPVSQAGSRPGSARGPSPLPLASPSLSPGPSTPEPERPAQAEPPAPLHLPPPASAPPAAPAAPAAPPPPAASAAPDLPLATPAAEPPRRRSVAILIGSPSVSDNDEPRAGGLGKSPSQERLGKSPSQDRLGAATTRGAVSRREGPQTARRGGSMTTRTEGGSKTGRLGGRDRKQYWAQIRALRFACRTMFFSCEQVRGIMEWFAEATFQVEALAVLFARVVDLHALWPGIMLRLHPRYGTWAVHRLGLLNLFNPEFMEAKYRLDLSVREQHVVAHWLALLASYEPGENWFEETYNGMGFECPSFWVREPPHTGIFTVQYQSMTPDMRRRRELREKTLLFRPPAVAPGHAPTLSHNA